MQPKVTLRLHILKKDVYVDFNFTTEINAQYAELATYEETPMETFEAP